MYTQLRKIAFSLALASIAAGVYADEVTENVGFQRLPDFADSIYVAEPLEPIEKHYETLLDSLMDNVIVSDTVVSFTPLPRYFFMPVVYRSYNMPEEPRDAFAPDYTDNPAMSWVEDQLAVQRKMRRIYDYALFSDPAGVKYNTEMLPTPPKTYTVVLNPELHTIEIVEKAPVAEAPIENKNLGIIHWLQTFSATLQFSQSYVSPNWYQGGNNNVNMISNFIYDLKLNQKVHPTLLFDNTFQYKLAMNSAPEDEIRGYNISEDLLQVNSTFGLKAVKKWYYTVNLLFKTQLLNSYKTNTNDLRSAFLSPGELNAGIGMTYNTANAKKTFTFDASISPLSYNLMICTSDRINHGQYKIDDDKKTASHFGSSGEIKISWAIMSNIKLRTRFFTFTDYDRIYADLENTLVFDINKYFTTQVFCHLRYDSLTPTSATTDWKKLQVKEIISLGFSYKFSTI